VRHQSAPVVVITGASSGIGRETARTYARRRARLVLASRSLPALETVARECRALGAQVQVVPTDVAQEGAVRALAAAAVAEFGRIDVWVGNAGVFGYGSFEQTPARLFRQVVETNLMGQVHGARAVLPHFRRQGSGTLVLVGSLFSRVSSPSLSAYVTSKHGLLGFAESLRQDLRGSRGIQVRVILPATIDTPVYQHAFNMTGRCVHPLPPVSSPHRVARAIERSPRRRRFATHVGQTLRGSVVLHRVSAPAYDAVNSFLMDNVELRGDGAKLTDGTVFEPPVEAGATTGGWRSPAKRMLGWTAVAGVAAVALTRRR
jgi:short-subunit dehydrogenase